MYRHSRKSALYIPRAQGEQTDSAVIEQRSVHEVHAVAAC